MCCSCSLVCGIVWVVMESSVDVVVEGIIVVVAVVHVDVFVVCVVVVVARTMLTRMVRKKGASVGVEVFCVSVGVVCDV